MALAVILSSSSSAISGRAFSFSSSSSELNRGIFDFDSVWVVRKIRNDEKLKLFIFRNLIFVNLGYWDFSFFFRTHEAR